MLNMKSIFIKKHETDLLLIWDQYLSENMKWEFGNMGAMSIEKREMAIW